MKAVSHCSPRPAAPGRRADRHRSCATVFNWPKLSAISAVTPHPQAYLHLVPDTIASDEVIRFVRHLLRRIPTPLFLLWDGGNPHRSRRTREALAVYRSRLRVFRLPAYAPELNPDEWLWHG